MLIKSIQLWRHDTHHNGIKHKVTIGMLSVANKPIMLSVFMLSVVMLNLTPPPNIDGTIGMLSVTNKFIMPSVFMVMIFILSVFMLNVVRLNLTSPPNIEDTKSAILFSSYLKSCRVNFLPSKIKQYPDMSCHLGSKMAVTFLPTFSFSRLFKMQKKHLFFLLVFLKDSIFAEADGHMLVSIGKSLSVGQA
jgi:hypothetical protein